MIQKLMASGADRFINCPYSAKMSDNGLTVNLWERAAGIGSAIHAAAEDHIRAPKRLSSILKSHGIMPKHPDFQKAQNAVTVYSAYVRRQAKKGMLYIEEKHRIHLDGVECVAKMDSMVRSKNTLRIYDLKTGNYDYSSSAWNQLYFTGLVYAHSAGLNAVTIEPAVIQPTYSPRPIAEMDAVTIADVQKELKKIITAIETAEHPTPGSHCTFCPALLSCPAVRNLISHIITAPPAEEVSKQFLENVWLNKKIIETYLTQTEEIIKTKLQAGESFGGLHITTGYGHRRWIDTAQVTKELEYLGDKLFEPRKLISPAQMEKLAGKKNIEGLYVTPEIPKIAVRKTEFEAVE